MNGTDSLTRATASAFGPIPLDSKIAFHRNRRFWPLVLPEEAHRAGREQ